MHCSGVTMVSEQLLDLIKRPSLGLSQRQCADVPAYKTPVHLQRSPSLLWLPPTHPPDPSPASVWNPPRQPQAANCMVPCQGLPRSLRFITILPWLWPQLPSQSRATLASGRR